MSADPAVRADTPPAAEAVRWRWPVVGVGLAVLGYGLLLLATGSPSASPASVAVWLVGGLAAHDGLLAPLAVLAGAVVVRGVPHGPARRVVGAGLLVAACLVVVALPALATPGVTGNPTATPRDYPRGLAVLLAVTATTTAALLVTLHVRQRRRPAPPPP